MQQTVKMRFFLPYSLQRTSDGWLQENDKGVPCAGLSFSGKPQHLPLTYLPIIAVNADSDIYRLTVRRDSILLFIPRDAVCNGKCLAQ